VKTLARSRGSLEVEKVLHFITEVRTVLTVRGKRFRGAHVHSILKKRLVKEKLLKREYPEVWSDFSLEVVDKTLVMSDFGFGE